MVQMTDNLKLYSGTYTRVSEEKYEDFLKVLNVGFMLRKAALASTPVMTITEAGGNWTMVTKTTMKSIELKFRLGEEFDETTTDGSKDVKAVREFNDDGLVLTMTCDGTSSKQVYKR